MKAMHVQRGNRTSEEMPGGHRKLSTRRLPRSGSHRFRIRFSRQEMDGIQELLGVSSVGRMMFEGTLARESHGAWRLDGHLGATVVQPCVATLRPVKTRIEESIVRAFVPDLEEPGPNTVSVCPDDDTVEPLPEVIDLFHIATEALSLGLPDYPRHNYTNTIVENFEQVETPNPFAALAVLKEHGE